MKDRFCNPQDLCMADAMPFQQHFECRTQRPLAEVVADPLYFNNVRSNLRAGDHISICRYEGEPGAHHDARVVEFCEVRVVSTKRGDNVVVTVVRPIVEIAADGAAVEAAKPNEFKRYISGSGEVRWNPGRKAYEIVVDGAVVVAGISRERKEWAQAVARGDEPLPDEDSLAAA